LPRLFAQSLQCAVWHQLVAGKQKGSFCVRAVFWCAPPALSQDFLRSMLRESRLGFYRVTVIKQVALPALQKSAVPAKYAVP